MVQIQLLIVHTQPLIVAGIHALVAHLHHWQVVGQTTQAFDALRFVQNHAVDVVLTEQRLPGLSGVALCAALRKHDADVSLGIIGDLSAAEETIALAHGVGIFLT
ncbi:MAG: response regulator, partial [Roseiflexaceae bacterium]